MRKSELQQHLNEAVSRWLDRNQGQNYPASEARDEIIKEMRYPGAFRRAYPGKAAEQKVGQVLAFFGAQKVRVRIRGIGRVWVYRFPIFHQGSGERRLPLASAVDPRAFTDEELRAMALSGDSGLSIHQIRREYKRRMNERLKRINSAA